MNDWICDEEGRAMVEPVLAYHWAVARGSGVAIRFQHVPDDEAYRSGRISSTQLMFSADQARALGSALLEAAKAASADPTSSQSESKSISPLEMIYRQIRQAMAAGLFFPAIAVAVSLPDVCATLEGRAPTNRDTYKTWFRENVASRFSNLGPDECWELRCGVVHNARGLGGRDRRSRYDRIIFSVPETGGGIHDSVSRNNGGTTESALFLDAAAFCLAMIAAAEEWEASHSETDSYKANIDFVLSYRPLGVFPHVYGAPVVA